MGNVWTDASLDTFQPALSHSQQLSPGAIGRPLPGQDLSYSSASVAPSYRSRAITVKEEERDLSHPAIPVPGLSLQELIPKPEESFALLTPQDLNLAIEAASEAHQLADIQMGHCPLDNDESLDDWSASHSSKVIVSSCSEDSVPAHDGALEETDVTLDDACDSPRNEHAQENSHDQQIETSYGTNKEFPSNPQFQDLLFEAISEISDAAVNVLPEETSSGLDLGHDHTPTDLHQAHKNSDSITSHSSCPSVELEDDVGLENDDASDLNSELESIQLQASSSDADLLSLSGVDWELTVRNIEDTDAFTEGISFYPNTAQNQDTDFSAAIQPPVSSMHSLSLSQHLTTVFSGSRAPLESTQKRTESFFQDFLKVLLVL